jgi:hypothetical protein
LFVLRGFGEFFRAEGAITIAAPKIARANFSDEIAAILAVMDTAAPSPVSWAKLPFLAPILSERMALGLSAPKLIAEMLKIDAE